MTTMLMVFSGYLFEGSGRNRTQSYSYQYHRVRDGGNDVGVDRPPQDQVFSAGVRHSDAVVEARKGHLQDFVHREAGEVVEAHQRVVGEDRLQSQNLGVNQALVAEV